jgi:hypothetical protein
LVSIVFISDTWEEDVYDESEQNAVTGAFSICYMSDKLEITYDAVSTAIADYQLDEDGDEMMLQSSAMQFTIGYWISDAFEIVVRLESGDPNIYNDENIGEDDAVTIGTAGFNYRLSETSEASLNWVSVTPEDGDLPNPDAIIVQVQVWQ